MAVIQVYSGIFQTEAMTSQISPAILRPANRLRQARIPNRQEIDHAVFGLAQAAASRVGL